MFWGSGVLGVGGCVGVGCVYVVVGFVDVCFWCGVFCVCWFCVVDF